MPDIQEKRRKNKRWKETFFSLCRYERTLTLLNGTNRLAAQRAKEEREREWVEKKTNRNAFSTNGINDKRKKIDKLFVLCVVQYVCMYVCMEREALDLYDFLFIWYTPFVSFY